SIPPTPMIGFAVLSAVLFCLPTGLVAIYFAVKSRNAWKKGENKTAYDFNRSAKMWTGISFFLGLILFAFIMRMFM
ncbi:MAG: CD225/dispanin family protein, partial [Muribaculaceae bacterium]|nr:CD225/dispanin family protein [Muribaculaceae bacterium]